MTTKRKRRLSKKQKAWCDYYERESGFDPMMDDFMEGNMTFKQAAKRSISWLRDHLEDTCLSCERKLTEMGYD